MTDYTRLTIIGSHRKAQMVVPGDEPIGSLIPRLMHLLDEKAGAVSRPLGLVRSTGEQLDTTLSIGIASSEHCPRHQLLAAADTALYRAKVRQAVSEVEQALVTLQSTAERQADAQTAVEGYRAAFTGSEALYRGGLASLVELEDVRRSLLAASLTQVSLQGERLAAWVALYRALGGGWTADPAVSASVSSSP